MNIDKGANVTFCYVASSRWMATRFDMICAIFAGCTAIFAVINKNNLDTELLAISLSIVIEMMSMASSGIRLYAETLNFMTSS